MKQSLGLVEVIGMSTALVVADAMVKSANVNIIGIENSRGLGYMTIKITGDVGAVNAAVSAGKQIAIINNHFVSSKVIARPSDFVDEVFATEEVKVAEIKEEVKNEVQEESTEIKEEFQEEAKEETENSESVEIDNSIDSTYDNLENME